MRTPAAVRSPFQRLDLSLESICEVAWLLFGFAEAPDLGPEPN